MDERFVSRQGWQLLCRTNFVLTCILPIPLRRRGLEVLEDVAQITSVSEPLSDSNCVRWMEIMKAASLTVLHLEINVLNSHCLVAADEKAKGII